MPSPFEAFSPPPADCEPASESHSSCQATLATPAGRGAVATVLVTGTGAADIVDLLLRPAGGAMLSMRPSRVPVFGRWELLGGAYEEVVVCRFTDKQVEVHCHGGPAAAAAIIASLVERGCSEQAWQAATTELEHDVIATEARESLSQCRTARTARILLDQYNGAWHRELADLARLVDAGNRGEVQRRLGELLELAPLGLHLARPWRVVMAGPPNVGKSSLANALAGYHRAIVNATPGTTRDVLVVDLAFEGWPIELVDTAGIRGTDERVEAAGVRQAQAVQADAELVLLVADLSQPWTACEQALLDEHPTALVVHTKSDLVPDGVGADRPAGVPVSAKRCEGLESLIDAVVHRLVPRVPPPKTAVPFTERQVALLQSAWNAAAAGELDQLRRFLTPCATR